MLKTLHVANFGVLGDVTVDFDRGLSCMTGETGAGKSLLVDAIKLLLGARADTGDVRAGEREAVVEALFDLDGNEEVALAFAQAGYDAEDGEVRARRVISSDGRGRAWMQGRLCSARELRDLLGRLVSVAGQHAFIGLGIPAERLAMLDAYGGLGGDVATYRERFEAWRAVRAERDELLARQADREARRDYLAFVVSQFDALAPTPGEDEALAAQANVLRGAELLRTLAAQAGEALYDGSPSAFDTLGHALTAVRDMARIDPRAGDLAARVESLQIDAREAARDLAVYGEGIESDPAQLERVEARLEALRGLARRHGGSLAAAIDACEAARSELAGIGDASDRSARLSTQVDELRAGVDGLASVLSGRRAEVAERMSAEVTDVLRGLAMAGATVTIRVAPCEPGESGADRVDFRVQTNPGEGWGEVADIASGGELSRITLALYAALSRSVGTPVMVYDEIDAGVSGGVAERMGDVLYRAGRSRQVLVVTHHAQVAARGDAHFLVDKETLDGRTVASVHRLDGEARVLEIARIIGGATLTEAVMRHARELVAGVGA